jgi:nitrogen regulatory protein P-II 1
MNDENATMKKIEAIIRHGKLGEVAEKLGACGFDAMTFVEAQGLGHEVGPKTIFRGGEVPPRFVQRHKLELIVDDDRADDAIDAIYEAAHTGAAGDGRIFVTDLDTNVHIRTGETFGVWRPADAS